MPVDSMAMVVTPHCVNQSAKAIRSAVQVPKERTCDGRLAGWLAAGGGASAGDTATQWMAAWTSMPAACGRVTRSAAEDGWRTFFRLPGVMWRRFFCLRGVMAAPDKERDHGTKRPRAREGFDKRHFPKRGHAERATNDVVATSRDHVNQSGITHHFSLGHLDPRP